MKLFVIIQAKRHFGIGAVGDRDVDLGGGSAVLGALLKARDGDLIGRAVLKGI